MTTELAMTRSMLAQLPNIALLAHQLSDRRHPFHCDLRPQIARFTPTR